MMRQAFIALLLCASTSAAYADTPTEMASFCERDASRIPIYPIRAQQRNVAGSATLACVLKTDDTLGTCEVIDEMPSGYGFGRSALRLACRWTPTDQQAASETPYAPGERHVRRTFRFGQGEPPAQSEHGSIIHQ